MSIFAICTGSPIIFQTARNTSTVFIIIYNRLASNSYDYQFVHLGRSNFVILHILIYSPPDVAPAILWAAKFHSLKITLNMPSIVVRTNTNTFSPLFEGQGISRVYPLVTSYL